MKIEAVAPDHCEAQRLILALDMDLLRRYPGETPHGIDAEEFKRANGYFVIARERSAEPAVACGAFRPILPDTAEIKRMYVSEGARGRGYAKAIVMHLESEALRRGFTRLILETGIKQPEAIDLYSKLGYSQIPAFGEYLGNTNSVCFEKRPNKAPEPTRTAVTPRAAARVAPPARVAHL